ncbi:MAG: 50S ribosomal protein L9 [Chloroflexi bacterium]|nr:50S ribosomal protein L9 [Chloroflexota bacterium]
MKVVFLENVPNVARVGEVKEVANGFARNYLLPRRLATLATPGELRRLEQERQVAERRAARLGVQAHDLAAKIAGQPVVLKARVGQQDRLYGSITSQQIAEALSHLVGQPIDRRHLDLDEPLRKLGTYRIPLHLTRDVTATVTVIVEGPKGERAAEAAPPEEAPAAAPATGAELAEPGAAPPEEASASQE